MEDLLVLQNHLVNTNFCGSVFATAFIMYYSKLPYIIYRDYLEFGYLTDNRNYGYDTASKSSIKIGERIISKVGSVFYSLLTDTPQSLLDISEKLLHTFRGVSLLELKKDAEEFFKELSKDGFVRCCENPDNICVNSLFSYDNLNSQQNEVAENWETVNVFDRNWFSCYHLTRIHLNICGVCNERCIHCYFPNHVGDKMSKELFLRILSQCKKNNVLNITMSGGEPMLNANLDFFIRECRENNFSINILSNLTLLTESLIREFLKTPLLSVQTSLYSMDEKIHDSITNVKGSFVKTKKAIEILHKYNIPMQINCPVIKQNKDTYQDVLDWAKSLNIEASSDYMLFGCFDGSRRNLHCRLDLSEIKSIIQKEKQNKGYLYSIKHSPESESSICPVCYSAMCISPTGQIYPCEGWQSLISGDVNESTIAKVWEESVEIQKLRKLTINDIPKCRSCEDKDFCSICLIRNVNESEHLDYKDVNPYFCSIANIKKQLAKE